MSEVALFIKHCLQTIRRSAHRWKLSTKVGRPSCLLSGVILILICFPILMLILKFESINSTENSRIDELRFNSKFSDFNQNIANHFERRSSQWEQDGGLEKPVTEISRPENFHDARSRNSEFRAETNYDGVYVNNYVIDESDVINNIQRTSSSRKEASKNIEDTSSRWKTTSGFEYNTDRKHPNKETNKITYPVAVNENSEYSELDYKMISITQKNKALETTKNKPIHNTQNTKYNYNKPITDKHLISTNLFKSLDKNSSKSSQIGYNRTVTTTQLPENWKEAFSRKVIGSDKSILLDLAKTFDRVIRQEKNLTYFMYSGTLLGSYRHHDIIPWDDDVDLIADVRDRVAIGAALEKLHPKYQLFEAGPRLKFYSAHSQHKGRYPWSWPYLDIHFYRTNYSHIWDNAPEFHNYIYPKFLIFPLHPRPFGGLHLNAPRDSLAALRLTYPKSLPYCESLTYSHQLEATVSTRLVRIQCERLKDMYPFVYREKLGEGNKLGQENKLGEEKGVGIIETVVIGETRLNSHVVEEPSDVICDPFTLQRKWIT